ncbi:MAG: autotransporter outer membrane beta-barrel domain-containing protein, partial [Candidatus Neptunochlamydia sp.]|nr:autotransporter outer membrane beta-barrel domain-containing protein [Candidatus Neptunochlamydia sp.]
VYKRQLPGIYEAGTTYTFLQANAINGEFDQLLATHPLDFNLNYLSNAVQIQIASTGLILPEDINSLSGNAKEIAAYLFSPSTFSAKGLFPILRLLIKFPAGEFSDALLELGPQQFGALALSNLQTSVHTGHSMHRVKEAYENYFSTCYQSFRKPNADLDQSIWFNPIGYYYKQNEMEDQVPFNSRTYGFTTGYSARLFNHFIVNAGIGYSYSSLNWYQNNGCANIQSLSLSPSVGYMGKYGYAGIMVSGARSFYDVDRKIHFSNIKRTAHNNHKSYDLLTGFTGALKLKFPDKFQKNLFLLPTVNLDYLNIFENGYQESGAGAIDLSVRNIHSAFLRPEMKLKLLKQFIMDTICASTDIYVGWVRNIPLTNGNYTSRFYKQQTCSKNFTVQSYHSSTDQVILGAKLLMIHKDNFSIKMGYEANIGNHYNVQKGSINVDWMF